MIMVKDEKRPIEFYKKREGDQIWCVRYIGCVGLQSVSFDKKKILHIFGDYPKNFTKEEKELFDKENPDWKELLGG